MDEYVLGVDAGGTKTLALLATRGGEIIGRGQAGPGNLHRVGFAAASRAVAEAVRAAFVAAGKSPAMVAALCIGAAGAARADEIEVWTAWCASAGIARQVCVVCDADLVIAAALDRSPGIVVIGGTGSIAFAQDVEGRRFRVGGWGYIIDDQGGAYDIARRALCAVLRAYDGRGPATALTPAILAAYNCVEPPELVRQVYAPDVDRRQLAQLAVVVDQTARAGDPVARSIMDHAADELALLTVTAARAAGLDGRVRCGLAGGVLLHSEQVRDRWTAQMCTREIIPEPTILVDEPARGAILMAGRLCQVG